MGWSSWNSFGGGVDYGKVKAQMDALVRRGLCHGGLKDDEWLKDGKDRADDDLIHHGQP